MKTRIAALFLFLLCAVSPAFSERLSEKGGSLEKQKGQWILHLRGTPYERGYQHGFLLKEQIKRNISVYIDTPKTPLPDRVADFANSLPDLMPHVPNHFIEEMRGIADGSGIALSKIIMLNLFPEMFHCSGITVSGQASKDGELYHVRVLDYSIGKNLQSTAVLQVVDPDIGIPFLNISYAGFIGTITGMNLEKIAIGEIGGLGYGSWKGIPMAFLLRDILQYATTLDDVRAILKNSPRTCEYYYVFSDGKTNESVGVYATASQLQFIAPGDSYALLAPSHLPDNYGKNGDNDKFVLTSCTVDNTPYQTLLFENDQRLAALFRLQPPDCLLLTGYPHPERYPVLIERLKEKIGGIDEKALMEIVKRPVARESNLHNAIFKPSQLKVWIAHAGPNDEPACDQNYQEWDFAQLYLNQP
ncbi:MAG: C45 family peptidase [Rhabdochlamydiaceae bacterium]|jgi:isopenicillin-N N-acyltransferase-like protein